jgi:carbonic anhydrase/acetyltransferase-like protein (isoleucine patch superfamily)
MPNTMLLSHLEHFPQVDPSAYVAPTATVCGNVVIAANARIMHGASIVAEGGRIEIGSSCIVMENAVVRSTSRHSTRVGPHCLVGPNAHLVGCTVEDEVFIATGAAVFHGAQLGKGSEVRIHGVVHVKSKLPQGETVPIGWVAVGDPIKILPPDQHDQIWALQRPLNFPLVAYGFERQDANMVRITERLADLLGSHRDDSIVPR